MAITLALCALPSVLADDLLHRYDGDVLPYDPGVGWLDGLCEYPCSEDITGGHLVLRWAQASDTVFYFYRLKKPPDVPPPSFWVEWRFRSNHPMPAHTFSCDAMFTVDYAHLVDSVFMYGDAVVSFSGSEFVLGLELDEFHTYRFESPDGMNFWFSVDGLVFRTSSESGANGYGSLLFGGVGGCLGDEFPDMVNRWDHVRFGTISYGEKIVRSNPPAGFVDARAGALLDRFTVTYDQANYVYIDEITVETTGGVTPVVTKTRRLNNGEPDTVEIILDRPIPFDATTRFTFDDGVAVNVVEYTLAEPVPATSTWTLFAMTLLVLTAGTLVLRGRADPATRASY